MNRPIKFRAWDKGLKKMKYMDSLSWGAFWDEVDQTYSDAPILQQFTEVKDRNGADIYEGDIVKDTQGTDALLETRKSEGWYIKKIWSTAEKSVWHTHWWLNRVSPSKVSK